MRPRCGSGTHPVARRRCADCGAGGGGRQGPNAQPGRIPTPPSVMIWSTSSESAPPRTRSEKRTRCVRCTRAVSPPHMGRRSCRWCRPRRRGRERPRALRERRGESWLPTVQAEAEPLTEPLPSRERLRRRPAPRGEGDRDSESLASAAAAAAAPGSNGSMVTAAPGVKGSKPQSRTRHLLGAGRPRTTMSTGRRGEAPRARAEGGGWALRKRRPRDATRGWIPPWDRRRIARGAPCRLRRPKYELPHAGACIHMPAKVHY